MKRILLAGVLGGLTTFVMGFVLWVVLPVQFTATQEFRSDKGQDSQLSAWFQALEQGTGTYFVPQRIHDPEANAEARAASDKEWATAVAAGPYAVIHLWPSGVDMEDPMTFARGLLLAILAAALAAALLSMARPGLSYFQRVLFVTTLACFVSLVGPLTSANFQLQPWEWGFVLVFDHVLTWLVSGLVIAGLVGTGGTAQRARPRD